MEKRRKRARRETGGAVEEAPRNDRSGGKAGQIHLARAGNGPRGPISGEDEDGRVFNKIHPDPPLRKEGKTERLERGAYSPLRWYNEVFRGLYESAAGQPALTGGREYKSAETYFGRLRELNPEMSPGDIYELAGEGAAFMMGSQMEGGVFGWMHKPPDICLLASQAQSVEWHLRKMRGAAGVRDGPGEAEAEGSSMSTASVSFRPSILRQSSGQARSGRAEAASAARPGAAGTKKSYMSTDSVLLSFIEKIREGHYASEQIERVYGELRGIESASHKRALRRSRG